MEVIIIGGGRHALVVRSCLDPRDHHAIGVVDDRLPAGSLVEDLPMLGPLNALTGLLEDLSGRRAIIAVGDNHARRAIAERMEAACPQLRWATAVHHSAIVDPTAQIGEGAVIAAGSVVSCYARIGRHALINTGSIIDHDGRVGEFASTGPGVVTGGNVHIGNDSHIGLGAVVSHGISIGDGTVIGGNAFVGADVPGNVVSYGSPAKIIRMRSNGEPYL